VFGGRYVLFCAGPQSLCYNMPYFLAGGAILHEQAVADEIPGCGCHKAHTKEEEVDQTHRLILYTIVVKMSSIVQYASVRH